MAWLSFPVCLFLLTLLAARLALAAAAAVLAASTRALQHAVRNRREGWLCHSLSLNWCVHIHLLAMVRLPVVHLTAHVTLSVKNIDGDANPLQIGANIH